MARHRKHRNCQDPHTAADLWLEGQFKVTDILHHDRFLNLAGQHDDPVKQVVAVLMCGVMRGTTLGWIQRQERWSQEQIAAGVAEANRQQQEHARDLSDRGFGYVYIGG